MSIYFMTAATITKMSAFNNSVSTSGAVSNVTVSLARPVITSTNPVAIVPGAGSSLVTHSPSKLVATSATRPTAHRAGTITGIVAGGNPSGASVVSLASVTVQGLQSQVRIEQLWIYIWIYRSGLTIYLDYSCISNSSW